MFNWLNKLIGMLLAFFDSITGHYALALLLYALVFKLVFLPFAIKQQKNSIKMAKLQPKIALIRAKYKGRTDQVTMQKQQQEIMELQKKEGYSAMSGCLPLLIQLPLIVLLYAVINSPLTYIAKTNSVIDDYNNNEYISGEIKNNITEYYPDFIDGAKWNDSDKKDYILLPEDGDYERGDKIEKGDVILKVYQRIPHLSLDGESEEDYLKRKYATSLPNKGEIEVINKIQIYIDADRYYSENCPDKEAKIAFIESMGLDVESVPNFRIGNINLADKPLLKNFSILVIIPVLTAAASWVSMWLTKRLNRTGLPQAGDGQTNASMKIMDLVMPLMTLWIAFSVPAMLGLYWIYQSLLGLGQSFALSKIMPLPKYTEEELKQMRKAEKEAEKAARNAAKAQPKHRSLHYIDDDDYEELPEVKTKDDDNKKSGGMGSDMPEIKD